MPKTLSVTIATAVSAALFYFGGGLHPIWPLLWFAPVPVLMLSSQLRARTAFLLGFAVYAIGATNQWNYFVHAIGIPLPVVLLILVIPSIFFGLGVLFTRSFLRRGLLFTAALSFAVYWVAFEYLTEIRSPNSTFGNLAYTQMNCLPVIQIASITGIWGISFIIFLFAGTIAVLLSGAGTQTQRRILAVAAGFVLCALFLFGTWRLRSNPPGQPVAVELIAKDVPMSLYLGSEEQALALLREYADEIRRNTPPGTNVVVLPEKIARVSESRLPEVDALFSSTTRAANTAIVVGLVRRGPSVAFNSSRFYSAEGKLEANYDKHHLVPGIEPEKPGHDRVVLNQPTGRWGLQICKDMDFPALSREYAAEGANILLVPAWDFEVDRWLHARMAVLRAVENGFALARSARNGLLTLSDNRGRILLERDTVFGRFVALSGKVNVTHETTFYSHTGDWFAWLDLATLIGLLITLIGSPKRNA